MSTTVDNDIDNRSFAHQLALFMKSQFEYRLAQVTAHPHGPPKPTAPDAIGHKLLESCLLAVDQCIAAFTNPLYIDWDYEEYCNDCIANKLSDGRNSAKEHDLRQRWGPVERGTMRINSPRTVVDLQGRIILWVLPNAISSYLQDHLHEATRCVEDTLVSNLNAANSQGKRPPWRIQRKRFNQDTCYIRSGAANLSPAWFTPGSNIDKDPVRSTPLLRQAPGHAFLNIGRDAFALVSGVLLIIHPEQYWMAKAIQDRMIERGCCSDTLNDWPSVHTAVSVIANRATPFHRDRKSRVTWYDLITSIGPYDCAPMYLSPVNIRVDNSPGTICGFSGLAHRHAVRRCNLARISLAWYMREDVRKRGDVEPASWMFQRTYRDFVGPRGIRVDPRWL